MRGDGKAFQSEWALIGNISAPEHGNDGVVEDEVYGKALPRKASEAINWKNSVTAVR